MDSFTCILMSLYGTYKIFLAKSMTKIFGSTSSMVHQATFMYTSLVLAKKAVFRICGILQLTCIYIVHVTCTCISVCACVCTVMMHM